MRKIIPKIPYYGRNYEYIYYQSIIHMILLHNRSQSEITYFYINVFVHKMNLCNSLPTYPEHIFLINMLLIN